MKYFYIPAVIVLLLAACKTGQNLTSSTSSLKEVSIVNVGELMSTYNLKQDTSATKAIDGIAGITAAQKDDIYKYANESSWPAGLNTLSNRAKNSATIKTYKAYQLVSFTHPTKGTLYIIKIPQAENSGMTGDFALSHDIYFIMSEKGFTAK